MKKLFTLLALAFCLNINAQTSYTLSIIPPDSSDHSFIYCSGTPYNFTGAIVPTGTIISYGWASNPGTNVSFSPSLANADTEAITFPSGGTYTLTLFAKTSFGIDTVNYVVTVVQSPNITVTPTHPVFCAGSSTGINLYASGLTTYTWTGGVTLLDANGDSVNVNPTTPTPPHVYNYTVTGNTVNGCPPPLTVASVTVIPIPTPYFRASPDSLCAGDNTFLAVDSMPITTTYTWSAAANAGLGSNSGSFVLASPIYAGGTPAIHDTTFTYQVLINVPGCPAYSSPNSPHTFSIAVLPLPVVSITASSYSICNGGSGINLHAHGAHIYNWTNGASASPLVYLDTNGDSVWVNPSATTPPQSFIYSVIGTGTNTCASPPVTITITTYTCLPPYQKMLADSVTEFDIVSTCYAARLSNPNQTLSTCINLYGFGGGSPNLWYAKGDSLHAGKIYKKIIYNNVFQGLMREDTVARKVYFIQYCNTYEELLYNFSLNQGDTITYHFPYSSTLMTSGVFTVDSIRMRHDYKTYYRNHFYLKNHSASGNDILEMIEGVGSVTHPLFLYYPFQENAFNTTFTTCSAANFNMALSCKWNNGSKTYYDSCLYHEAQFYGGTLGPDSCTYCWGITGGIEQYSNTERVTIAPNPNNGSFIIEPNSTTKQTLQVYDVNGTFVLSQTLNGKTNIDATSLNEGIYNISLISNEGIVNKRLVIVR